MEWMEKLQEGRLKPGVMMLWWQVKRGRLPWEKKVTLADLGEGLPMQTEVPKQHLDGPLKKGVQLVGGVEDQLPAARPQSSPRSHHPM